MVCESLSAFWHPQSDCHVPFTEEWLPSGHSTIKAWLVECCRDGCLSDRAPEFLSTEELWSSVRVTIWFLVTYLTKALLPQLLSLAGWPALGRALVVPIFFHLRMMEVTFLGDPQCCKKKMLFPSTDLCLDTILSSRSSMDNFFDLIACFLLWHALSTVGPYIDRCVPFQIMSNHLNLPQVTSNEVVETSQGWSMETECSWAPFRIS